MTEAPYKYWAFISYNRNDAAWASWLHKSIETYGIPAQLAGRPTPSGDPAPDRFHPIFKDREEMPAAPDLHANVLSALEQSRYLIVICSPNAAQSAWVNREVEAFVAMGRQDRIFSLIVGGEPPDCFPAALREIEPIAADAREVGDGRNNAKLKLLAGMLGVGFDALRQRDHLRRIRRLQGLVSLMATLVLAFGLLTFYANNQRVKATETLANADFREGVNRVRKPETTAEGMAFLARAVRLGNHPQAASRLWTLMQQRSFWVEADVSSSDRPVASPMVSQYNPTFSTVDFYGQAATPVWIGKSEDESTWVTVLNLEEGLTSYFKLWRSDGTALTLWTALPKDQHDVREVKSAHLTPDGKQVAFVCKVWRDPEIIRLYDTVSGRFSTDIIEATGPSPIRQFASFEAVRIVQRSGQVPILLAGSYRGDATAWAIRESYATKVCERSHDRSVKFVELDSKGDWLISVSSDRWLKVTDKLENPVGLPFEVKGSITAASRPKDDAIRIVTAEGTVAEFRQIPPYVAGVPSGVSVSYNPFAPIPWEVQETNFSTLPLPKVPTVFERNAAGRSLRLSAPNTIDLVESGGGEKVLWTKTLRGFICKAGFGGKGAVVVQTSDFSTYLYDEQSGAEIGPPLDEQRVFAGKRRPADPDTSYLSQDNQRLLTRSDFYDAPNVFHYWSTVWDVGSGTELIDPLRTSTDDSEADGEANNSSMLTGDGKLLLIGQYEHPGRIAIQLDPPAKIRARLAEFAEALGGLRLKADGSFESVPNRREIVDEYLLARSLLGK